MNIESEIGRLLLLAAPLRALDEDDPAKIPLNGIVMEVNRLRAVQAQPGFVDMAVIRREVGLDPQISAATSSDLFKRKLGRPAKARIEGADAA
jgi:hypothetical protein